MIAIPKGLAKERTRILRSSVVSVATNFYPSSPPLSPAHTHVCSVREYMCVRALGEHRAARPRLATVGQSVGPAVVHLGPSSAVHARASSLRPLRSECVLVARAWCSSRPRYRASRLPDEPAGRTDRRTTREGSKVGRERSGLRTTIGKEERRERERTHETHRCRPTTPRDS